MWGKAQALIPLYRAPASHKRSADIGGVQHEQLRVCHCSRDAYAAAQLATPLGTQMQAITFQKDSGLKTDG
jgi:hypothetical protein